MAEKENTPSIWRPKTVSAKTGLPLSTIRARRKAGLLPSAVPIGARSVGYVSSEIEAVIRAQIAGRSDDQIRDLVARLAAQRAKAA
jgi:prophage regulatory protein